MFTIILSVFASLLSIVYGIGEYYNVWDCLTGRKDALEGLARLKSTSGYPVAWIYDDGQDRTIFNELEKRISKYTKEDKIIKILKDGYKPSLIVVGGNPILLNGIPDEWTQDQKYIYLGEHPILYCFNVQRDDEKSIGKCSRVCNISELEKLLEKEKESRKFYVATVAIGLLGLIAIILRNSIVL